MYIPCDGSAYDKLFCRDMGGRDRQPGRSPKNAKFFQSGRQLQSGLTAAKYCPRACSFFKCVGVEKSEILYSSI